MEHREIVKLKVNPLNPRGEVLRDVSLRELAASMKSHGVLQPILITPDGMIVAGHRRVAAAKLIDLTEIPVVIKELSEAEQLQVVLIENLQRNDLTLLQTAKAYRELTNRGLTVDFVSKAIGVTKRSVSEHLGIFRLPEELWIHFEEGSLTLRSVPPLLEVAKEDQIWIAQEAIKKKWGAIKISAAVYRLKNPKPNVANVANTLERIWGRVQDGCYTPETIAECSECGHDLFGMTADEIRVYLQTLVDDGRAEWRKQGGKKDNERGPRLLLCVPADMPSGEGFEAAQNKTVWSKEAWM